MKKPTPNAAQRPLPPIKTTSGSTYGGAGSSPFEIYLLKRVFSQSI